MSCLECIIALCHISSSANTITNGCLMLQTPIFVYRSECSKGFHGVNCMGNCSPTCGLPGNYNRITGHCNGGCQCGWAGFMCEKRLSIRKKPIIPKRSHLFSKKNYLHACWKHRGSFSRVDSPLLMISKKMWQKVARSIKQEQTRVLIIKC